MMQALSRFALFAKPVDRLLQEGVGTRFAQSFHKFMSRTATSWGPKLGPSRRAETAIDETNIDDFPRVLPRVLATFNLFSSDKGTATEAQKYFEFHVGILPSRADRCGRQGQGSVRH
jgi:hypothetical protein